MYIVQNMLEILVVSSYKESRNDKQIYGYYVTQSEPYSPNICKVQSVYNNNVAS